MLHKKITTSLFKGKYQYKIVLVCSTASAFRSENVEESLKRLAKIKGKIHELDYAKKIANLLSNQTDLEIRVESAWLSVYTNNHQLISKLANLNIDNVKYICEPLSGENLTAGTVLMPKMNYDYRVTLGKTTQTNLSFLEWAEKSSKCKLTKSCRRDLTKQRTWGGTHFYITGENNLLLAKMHLGASISKVERIIKA